MKKAHFDRPNYNNIIYPQDNMGGKFVPFPIYFFTDQLMIRIFQYDPNINK